MTSRSMRDASIERQPLGVRREGDRIMVRDGGAWQLRREAGVDGVGLRCAAGRRGRK